MKTLATKKEPKSKREMKVLFGLIALYIQTGKPVGSNTLKENGFDDLSSATIRNYFSKLEENGYLLQQHSSGGRIPTAKAYREYVNYYFEKGIVYEEDDAKMQSLVKKETKEITDYLFASAELLSNLTGFPVILSTPKLDMDFIQAIKLIQVTDNKILSILISDYGFIRTESFYCNMPFTSEELSLAERYIYWKLNKVERPVIDDPQLEKWANRLYNEIMVKHVIASSTKPMYYTGVSKLLSYPEFADASTLAEGLAFFEKNSDMDTVLEKCVLQNTFSTWIGPELNSKDLSVLAVPFYIGHTPVGAVAILGPLRLPYRRLFGVLRVFSNYISETLAHSVYKYKITFRKEEKINPSILLENKGTNL